MKKNFVFALIAAMTIGLVGCGETANTTDTASQVVEETTAEDNTTEETTDKEEVTEEVVEEEVEEAEEAITYAGYYSVTIPEGYVITDNNDKIKMDGNSSCNVNIRTYKSEVEKEKETWIGYGYTDAGVMTFNGIEWTVVTDGGAYLWTATGDAIVELQISGLTLEDEAVKTILDSFVITEENTYEANQAFFASKK